MRSCCMLVYTHSHGGAETASLVASNHRASLSGGYSVGSLRLSKLARSTHASSAQVLTDIAGSILASASTTVLESDCRGTKTKLIALHWRRIRELVLQGLLRRSPPQAHRLYTPS
jgi:hypothetical protein